MKLPFVSRKKYENLEKKFKVLWDGKVALEITNQKLELDLNDTSIALEQAKKDLETHINRSKSAQAREKNKRAAHIKKLTTTINELESLNDSIVHKNLVLETNLNEATKTIQELDKALNQAKKRPTVEEIKFEKIRHEGKLAGGKKKAKK